METASTAESYPVAAAAVPAFAAAVVQLMGMFGTVHQNPQCCTCLWTTLEACGTLSLRRSLEGETILLE